MNKLDNFVLLVLFIAFTTFIILYDDIWIKVLIAVFGYGFLLLVHKENCKNGEDK